MHLCNEFNSMRVANKYISESESETESESILEVFLTCDLNRVYRDSDNHNILCQKSLGRHVAPP